MLRVFTYGLLLPLFTSPSIFCMEEESQRDGKRGESTGELTKLTCLFDKAEALRIVSAFSFTPYSKWKWDLISRMKHSEDAIKAFLKSFSALEACSQTLDETCCEYLQESSQPSGELEDLYSGARSKIEAIAEPFALFAEKKLLAFESAFNSLFLAQIEPSSLSSQDLGQLRASLFFQKECLHQLRLNMAIKKLKEQEREATRSNDLPKKTYIKGQIAEKQALLPQDPGSPSRWKREFALEVAGLDGCIRGLKTCPEDIDQSHLNEVRSAIEDLYKSRNGMQRFHEDDQELMKSIPGMYCNLNTLYGELLKLELAKDKANKFT